jgi:diaminopimelate epimerase
MHGCGNDFLIFDPGEVEGADLPDLARRAGDRHFGVGADGILVPTPSEVADLEMVYFNSDGSPSKMCGNGLRCLARYAKDYELVAGEAFTIATGAGIKKLLLFEDGSSRVDMGPPEFAPEIGLGGMRFLRVSMGNPHAVAFLGSVAAVEELDLGVVGPSVEKAPVFPEGTNVEFVFAPGGREVRMRIGLVRRGGRGGEVGSCREPGSGELGRRSRRDSLGWREFASLHDRAGGVRLRGGAVARWLAAVSWSSGAS